MNISKNERSRFGQRLLLEPSLSPVSSSKSLWSMFGEKIVIIHSLVFQSFLLSVHSFPWAMFSSLAGKTSLFRVTLVGIGGVGCCLLWRSDTRNPSVNVVLAKSPANHSHVHSQTRRKAKFEQFASIDLDGQYFMTPADFLESLTHRDLQGTCILKLWLTHEHTPSNLSVNCKLNCTKKMWLLTQINVLACRKLSVFFQTG